MCVRSCSVPVHAHGGCLSEAVPGPSTSSVQPPSPPAQASSLACGRQVGVFLTTGPQCLSGPALTLTCFRHLCDQILGLQVLWTLKAINQELWMCVRSGVEPPGEWGLDPGRPRLPTLLSCVVLLLCASLAPSGGHAMRCTLPRFSKFLTHQLGSLRWLGLVIV